jgi:hypothetical protein
MTWAEFWTIFLGALKEAAGITLLVIAIMSAIELVNVLSGGKWLGRHLNGKGLGQTAFGAALGLIPGCFGGFTAVSLYSRRLLSFGALAAALCASTGDAAFVLLAQKPKQALLLFALILPVSILVGWLTDLIFKNNPQHITAESLEMHHEDEDSEEHGKNWRHFLKEHVWEHVVKKHALSIFCWCFGALLALGVIERFVDLASFTRSNEVLMMVIAVLIGLIPDSGPQIVIATMFSQGLIPFGILLANGIVQDGHVSLPLLAEEPRSFMRIKAINAITSLAVGFLWLALS